MVSASKRGTLGCPVCHGSEIQKGVNDFETRHGSFSKYWDYSRNVFKPDEVYYRSQEKYWFLCEKGHSFRKSLLKVDENNRCSCPICQGDIVLKGFNDLETLKPDIAKYWCKDINTLMPDEVTIGSNREVWFECANAGCNEVFLTPVCNRVSTNGFCFNCRKKNWSIPEKELAETIRSWGFSVEEEVRLFGGTGSLDIYIPSERVAIEYNGLYWHSDKVRKDKNYHLDKYKKCLEKGIQLLFIWEDDYLYSKDKVITMLRRKLGVSEERRINARDCKVCVESYNNVRGFLDNNHIQGSVGGSLYLSLRDKNNDIVAVGVFLLRNGDYTLLERYCSSCIVRGGFTKILKYFEENYNPIGVETFSDNGVSDGSLYLSSGFEAVEEIRPDYKYVVEGKRIHKFNYRISRFRDDVNLMYKEGLTERELAELNGLYRVYDAGKVKWKKVYII